MILIWGTKQPFGGVGSMRTAGGAFALLRQARYAAVYDRAFVTRRRAAAPRRQALELL